jgi:glycerol-3-phosphate acyltransferase PlsY
MWADVISAVVAGYLLGSIPAAYLIARSVDGIDVRQEGEGNVGARNVFHVVGARWGIATFLADFAKGAVVAAMFHDGPRWQLALAGVAVLAGHAYPIWLRFLGGKGLSTVGGFTVVLMPWAAAIGGAGAAVAWGLSRRFLPTTVVAIVLAIVAAPVTGVTLPVLATIVALFALTGVKRALDERRMREVEARTGWDRTQGMVS